jgi:hypothetical protein
MAFMRPESFAEEFVLEDYKLFDHEASMALAKEMQRRIEEEIMTTIMVPALAFKSVESAPVRKRYKTIG